MYELISLENDDMTRIVKLKNIDSGTIEDCFDDSNLVSDKGFDFMEVGQKYECKIKLFGKIVNEVNEKSFICNIIDRNIMIGTKKFVKITIVNDEYYIPQIKIGEYINKNTLIFSFTRKDLIQVNEVIHADLL